MKKSALHLSTRSMVESGSKLARQPSLRTSLDLELDLQASEAQLLHLKDELVRLRQIKQEFEEAKAKGMVTYSCKCVLLIFVSSVR